MNTESGSGSTYAVRNQNGKWVSVNVSPDSNPKAGAALVCLNLSVLRGTGSHEDPKLFIVGTLKEEAGRENAILRIDGWFIRCPFVEYVPDEDQPWERPAKLTRTVLRRSDFCGPPSAYTDEEKVLCESTVIHKWAGGAVYWIEHPPLQR